MIATQVNVLTMGAQWTENRRQNELRRRVLKPSDNGELFDLQHAEDLPLDVDDVGYDFRFQRSDFAKIIDKSNSWSQFSVSIGRQVVKCGVAAAKM